MRQLGGWSLLARAVAVAFGLPGRAGAGLSAVDGLCTGAERALLPGEWLLAVEGWRGSSSIGADRGRDWQVDALWAAS